MHGLPRPSIATATASRRSALTIIAMLTVALSSCGVLTGDDTTTGGTTGANGSASSGSAPTSLDQPPAASNVAATAPAPTVISATTTAPTTAPVTTTTTTTTTTTSTIPAPTTTLPTVPITTGPLDLSNDFVGIGFSYEGRPIFAERYGLPGGRRVLVIGVIHGNEDDGLGIVDELRLRDIPDGVELWLVESMNPDGVANQDRHNGNDVDLNRNFPYRWGPIGSPGDSQYAGVGPASEPETQAVVNLIDQLQPDIAIWYHQDAYLVIPSTGRDGRIRARYAELTGLPLADCCGGGGIYTGIAATWARQQLQPVEGVAFIVELGGTTSPTEVSTHADAVLAVAVEG